MQGTIDPALEAALMQRDAVMTLLIAQSHGLIQRLALLAGHEKAAVAGLVTIGQAMVVYARCARPDPEVMASFDRVLATLSPGLSESSNAPGFLQACLEEAGVYTGAIDACLRAGLEREPEAFTGVVEEAACLTRHLKTLLAAVTEPVDKRHRMTGVARSLPPHR